MDDDAVCEVDSDIEADPDTDDIDDGTDDKDGV